MADQDPNFYINGAKQMVAEGKEVVSKIVAFMKKNEKELKELEPHKRKKAILEFEPAKSFNSIHPIVFQYLAVEGVFNANAFKRYILAVYGKPKDMEAMEKARHDKKEMYHYKNAQSALYYKYLLMETNPNVDKNKIHKLYLDCVSQLNMDTDRMIDAYEKAEKESKIQEDKFNEEKRKELVELLKKKI